MDSSEDLRNALEDLEVVETKNKDLKENVKIAKKCIEKLREKIQKIKIRHKEASEEIKQENNTIADRKVKNEDNKKTKEHSNKMMECKSEECEKLRQEVTSLKVDLEKEKKQERKIESGKLDLMKNSKEVSETKKEEMMNPVNAHNPKNKIHLLKKQELPRKKKTKKDETESNIPSEDKVDKPTTKDSSVQVSIIGASSGTSKDAWKKIFFAPLNIPPITSSMQSADFSNVGPVQKLEFGEAFISSTRQDFQNKNKIVKDLSLSSHTEKIREKYKKDKVDDRENIVHEFKAKCESMHHQLSQLISQGQSYLENSDILFAFSLQWLDATKSIKDEMNIIEYKIRQAHANYKLSKDLSGSRRCKIEELHERIQAEEPKGEVEIVDITEQDSASSIQLDEDLMDTGAQEGEMIEGSSYAKLISSELVVEQIKSYPPITQQVTAEKHQDTDQGIEDQKVKPNESTSQATDEQTSQVPSSTETISTETLSKETPKDTIEAT
ncbi:uncharacterized protein LOC131857662 [Cryptomeria japonica]|uniref:uncharacterized protein LOC131857662 n=1 Tax=Cryptomeria japonica TaxID=3369 RepID=UPI0027D9F41C|nr:uncharacterized protein LOC131857662 [Cryptomeria japonica]